MGLIAVLIIPCWWEKVLLDGSQPAPAAKNQQCWSNGRNIAASSGEKANILTHISFIISL